VPDGSQLRPSNTVRKITEGHISSTSTDSNLQDELRDSVAQLNDDLSLTKNLNPIQIKATRKFSKSLYVKTSSKQTINQKKGEIVPNISDSGIFAKDILRASETKTIYQRQASAKVI
tara:strand:- start:906 stop:1256 length:351 start_codon:yes stop_codon:yes gene_type:complete